MGDFPTLLHSSTGKVLLSVGKDSTLKCWDLSRGLLSYSMKLVMSPTMIRWAGDDLYLVFSDSAIHVHSISSQGVIAKISSKHRINAGVTLSVSIDGTEQQVVVYGGEDKILRIASVHDGKDVGEVKTKHNLRIKDLARLPKTNLVASCSSDGLLLIWDIQKIIADQFSEGKEQDWIVNEYNCKCRLTCLEFVGGDKGFEKQEQNKLESKAAAEAAAIPESDYEDIHVAKKAKVLISYDAAVSENEVQDDKASAASVKKPKAKQSGHDLLFNKSGSEKKKVFKKRKQ